MRTAMIRAATIRTARPSVGWTALIGACLIAAAWLTVRPAAAQEAAGPPAAVPIEAMEQGGLFLPSDQPGYVVPATEVAADVDIRVNGLISRARIAQTFLNPTDSWVEGVYVFPLPETAAVDRLRLVIGDRVIEGEIKPRAEAEQIYAEARDAGQQASLVSQERPNLFTNAVANIPPHGALTVEIEYQQALDYEAGRVSLRFPTVVLPRYIPGEPTGPAGLGWAPGTTQVPDAARITPPVALPGTGPVNPISFDIELDPGFPLAAVESSTHPIVTEELGDGRYRVSLAKDRVWADRDFVLDWSAAPASAPLASLFRETVDGVDYHLLMIVPPTVEAAAAEPAPREVIFIIDTSGSMAGESIVQARQALLYALGRLGPEDRFNIIEFNDEARALFKAARPAAAAALAEGRRFVEGLVADGGTEMRAALELALARPAAADRLRQIVFVTDGSVGNEVELLGLIDDRLGSGRLFTVGIGSAPNSFFMREAAEIGRGGFTYIGRTDEVRARMGELFEKLERPAMTDIALSWPGATAPEIYPATLPDLYAGEPVTATLRAPAGATGDLVVSGRSAGQDWQRAVPLASARPAVGVAGLWGRDKILDLQRQGYRGGDRDALHDRIVEVALQFGLVSDYTSLVAVDPTVARPAGESLTTEAVATNMPHGVELRMAAAPAPQSVAAIHAMAATGSPFGIAALPVGGTSATLSLLLGTVCLTSAGLLVLLARRPRRRLAR